jgi:hypothetical protein
MDFPQHGEVFYCFGQALNQNNHTSISESSIETSKDELDGPAVSALQRVIAEVKQRWSVIGWVDYLELRRASAR